LSEAERKVTEISHKNEIERNKREFEDRLKDVQARLTSIERRVGNESFLDIKDLLVTPKTIPSLGKEYTFFDELRCYIAVPKGESWQFQKSSEMELSEMILGQENGAILRKNPMLVELSKEFPLFLWKSTNTFKIDSGDEDLGELKLFPFV